MVLMTSIEKRDWIVENKKSMSQLEMAAALNITKKMVEYFIYRFQKPRKRLSKNSNLIAVDVKPLFKITCDEDYSTNGIFDTDKWAKCLPV